MSNNSSRPLSPLFSPTTPSRSLVLHLDEDGMGQDVDANEEGMVLTEEAVKVGTTPR